MTRTNNTQTTRKHHILALILAILMCLSLTLAVACADDDLSDIPGYTYSEIEDSKITNSSFVIGTTGINYSSFPKTSVNGWTLDKNSSAKSGVIDVSDDGWNALLSNLYADSGILDYVKTKNNFDNEDVKTALNKQNASSSEIKNYIIDNYFDASKATAETSSKYLFKNPGKHADALDNSIYMMNNYRSNEAYGSIQKLSSSTEITLEKGQYAEISVFVKTANLNKVASEDVYGEEIGANIRVTSTFAGTTQEPFGIFNITDETWTKYTFYVKADSVYDTKFKVVLGLGYDNCKAEGTVYFDDIIVKTLDQAPTGVTTKSVQFNKEDNRLIDANGYTPVLFDMNTDFSAITGYTDNVATYVTENKEGVTITDISSDSNNPYSINDGIKVDLSTPSSYTFNITDKAGNNFTVDNEEYTAISFFVKNNLNKLYSTNISLTVKDINAEDISNKITEDRTIGTISEVSDEWKLYTIIVKNNFEVELDENDNEVVGSPRNADREFYIEVTIGSTTSESIDDKAKGIVEFSQAFYSTGSINQYLDDQVTKTDNYDYYSLFTAKALGTSALYAGSTADYTADEADTKKYNLTVAPSDLGVITSKPAQPKDYIGVPSNHSYINNSSNVIDINTNKTAGLINSQYIKDYTDKTAIEEALKFTETADVKSIQPLMVATSNASYGFISRNNYTINASEFAKISVKVRVADATAKAYVYLIDMSSNDRNALTFPAFKVNTTEGYKNLKDTDVSGQQLSFVLDSSMMGDDGWTTVTFYIATGANSKTFRLELWNGDRSVTENNQNSGYVFFNDVEVKTSGGFTESASYQTALTSVGNPLYNFDTENDTLYAYQRELTDDEVAYNDDTSKTGSNISYKTKYVWAKTDTMIYAVYNTIDPVVVDPYENEPSDEEETEEETELDPASFWLSLSSIILAVALLGALTMLIIKNVRLKMKANASDAKSHYKVVSRSRKTLAIKNEEPEKLEADIEETDIEVAEETEEVEQEATEQTLDEYVYGDVQVFGDAEENAEQTSEETSENSENE